MENLKIQSTASTPEINFDESGKLSIKGKALPEDPKKFFEPILNWVENFRTDEVHIDVKLEYVNTSSSKRIIELLKTIDSNLEIHKIDLNWHYEFDDPDMLEFGEIIERNLWRTKANYIGYEDE